MFIVFPPKKYIFYREQRLEPIFVTKQGKIPHFSCYGGILCAVRGCAQLKDVWIIAQISLGINLKIKIFCFF